MEREINTIPHAEIDKALHWAQIVSRTFTTRLPNWMDKDAFSGEAFFAVAKALHTYDSTKETSFGTYCYLKVYYALKEEQRRQDPAGRTRRTKIKSGEIEETAKDLPVLSLDGVLASRIFENQNEELPLLFSVLSQHDDEQKSIEEQAVESIHGDNLRFAVGIALSKLPVRDAEIIRLRYLEQCSRKIVGERLKLSPTYLKNLETQALANLRKLVPELEEYIRGDD